MEESVERVKRYLKNFEGDKKDFEAILDVLNGYIESKSKKELETIDKNVANDSVIAHKFAVIQQQINEKDKRIQELEEIDEANRKVIVEQCDYIQNYTIPKQKVKDKIKELKNDIKQGNCRYPYIEEHKIEILQELLEGEK